MELTLFYTQLQRTLQALSMEVDVEELRQLFTYKRLNKGEHYIREGSVEKGIAFVCQGLLRYYYITYNGDDVTKHFTVENQFASSYSSLIYQRPSAYSIVAEEECHLLILDSKTYMHKVWNEQPWERIARLNSENIYSIKEQREAVLLTMTAQERYLDFKENYPAIENRLKQKHIATYLGIHPASLSRIKKQLNR